MTDTSDPITQLTHADVKKLRTELFVRCLGMCPICQRSFTDAVLDHSHKKRHRGTGLIRGVLCRTCNSLLAKMENNAVRYRVAMNDLPGVLTRMAGYLKRPHLPYMHPSERPKPRRLMKSSYNQLVNALIDSKYRSKSYRIPKYTGRMTKKLARLFEFALVTPRFYR